MINAEFAVWMHAVDRALERLCGLTALDLPDACWHDYFDDGYQPEDAAEEYLTEAEAYDL